MSFWKLSYYPLEGKELFLILERKTKAIQKKLFFSNPLEAWGGTITLPHENYAVISLIVNEGNKYL